MADLTWLLGLMHEPPPIEPGPTPIPGKDGGTIINPNPWPQPLPVPTPTPGLLALVPFLIPERASRGGGSRRGVSFG